MISFDRPPDDADVSYVICMIVDAGLDVSIQCGRLLVAPAGREMDCWIAAHWREITGALLSVTGVRGYLYERYCTGYWGEKKAAGVSLEFVDVCSGEIRYTIFNADLKRTRNTTSGKAGDPLPAGHFTVGKRSKFVQFWTSTDRKAQKLSTYHEYMGNLCGIVFEGEPHDFEPNRFRNVKPFDLDAGRVREAIVARASAINMPPTECRHAADKQPTEYRQSTDSRPTTLTDNESPHGQHRSGVGRFPTTGANSCGRRQEGTKVVREQGGTGAWPQGSTHVDEHKEWLDAYDRVPRSR